MKIKDLILFQDLTDAELEKSIVCSQSVMQTFEKMNISSMRKISLAGFILYWKEVWNWGRLILWED